MLALSGIPPGAVACSCWREVMASIPWTGHPRPAGFAHTWAPESAGVVAVGDHLVAPRKPAGGCPWTQDAALGMRPGEREQVSGHDCIQVSAACYSEPLKCPSAGEGLMLCGPSTQRSSTQP